MVWRSGNFMVVQNSTETLKDVPDEFWTTMKFPLRLVQVIKENLNVAAPAPVQPTKPAAVEKDEEMAGYEEEIKTSKAPTLTLKKDLSEKTTRLEKLGAALGKLFDGKTDVKDTRETLKTLQKIVQNVIKEPLDPKFR